MTLTEKEELLVDSLRALPQEAADQVIRWTKQLADLAGGRPVEWSDSWTDEDLRDATAAAARNFDDRERTES